MEALLQITQCDESIDSDRMASLRQALLFLDWRKKRPIGMRRLERFSKAGDPTFRSIAMAGLALGAYWDADLQMATKWSRLVLHHHPLSAAALWSSSLLVVIYRRLGMRKERFEAERERIRMLRRLAFESQQSQDRAYALSELKRELEDRNLVADARRYDEELADLLNTI